MTEFSYSRRNNLLKFIRGLPFLYGSHYTERNIKEVFNYIPHDDDIVITSYPKTGTNWLQYTVWQILHQGQILEDFNVYDIGPLMELYGVTAIDKLESPRIYRHHLTYNWTRHNDKAKYLYIYRKPEDVFVSYYHYLQSLYDKQIDFNLLFEDFLNGNIAYGSYFEHVRSYLTHSDDVNMLITSFEKLYSDRESEVLRIAKFLGDEYYQVVSNCRDVLCKILEHTEFESMKSCLYLRRPMDERKLSFFRKGIIGDGREVLGSDQLKRLKIVAEGKLKGFKVVDEWF